jgi:hypothetical protein
MKFYAINLASENPTLTAEININLLSTYGIDYLVTFD